MYNKDVAKKLAAAKEAKEAGKPKKTPAKAPNKSWPAQAPSSTYVQSPRDQQRLLNIFSDTFADVLSSENYSVILQEIKQALFNREFAKAFGREDYLAAYAARWSPTRALSYAAVFSSIKNYLAQIALPDDEVPTDLAQEPSPTQEGTETTEDQSIVNNDTAEPSSSSCHNAIKRVRMFSIGGCAAEHVAFASYLHDTALQGTLTLLDSGPWSPVTSLLQTQLTTSPPISKYASAAVRASNTALITPSQLSVDFVQHDILSLEKEKLGELVGTHPLVVTLLFTLNELYTTAGIGKTTKFLRTLGEVLSSGSMLLVVDSPGSYSEATLGKEKKRYPMQWLVHHTLVETDAAGYTWERLESQDSVWFRMPEGLSYPIQLENMRYQTHLYKIQKT